MRASSNPVYPVTPTTAMCLRVFSLRPSASMRLCSDSRDFLFGRDDQHGVIARDGAGDFRKFCAVHRRRQWLRAARRRLQHQQDFPPGEYPAEIRPERAPAAARSESSGQRRSGFVSLVRLDQPQLLQIARKVACVTRSRCAASRRRNSSWLAMEPSLISLRICP